MHDKIRLTKTYYGAVFEKKFHYELDPENKETFSLLQTRSHLKRMYEESKDLP